MCKIASPSHYFDYFWSRITEVWITEGLLSNIAVESFNQYCLLGLMVYFFTYPHCSSNLRLLEEGLVTLAAILSHMKDLESWELFHNILGFLCTVLDKNMAKEAGELDYDYAWGVPLIVSARFL